MRLWLAVAIVAAGGGAFADEPVIPKASFLRPSRESQAQLWNEAMQGAKNAATEPPKTEAGRMLAAMMSGGKMDGATGWWGPSHVRYTWDWLSRRFDRDGDGHITAEELGQPNLFVRLDRDHDGAVSAEDFDWSEKSAFLKQQTQATQIFRMLDKDGDGQLTREEWNLAFDRLAKGKDSLAADDLQPLLFPSAGKGSPGKGKGGKGPSKEILMKAFMDGDAGSPFEGPRIGDDAPDFALPTYDGRGRIVLSDYRDKKPVVLIFGSFT